MTDPVPPPPAERGADCLIVNGVPMSLAEYRLRLWAKDQSDIPTFAEVREVLSTLDAARAERDEAVEMLDKTQWSIVCDELSCVFCESKFNPEWDKDHSLSFRVHDEACRLGSFLAKREVRREG